jgi:HAD superfamily hydrolase (TIGR01458 family)
VTSNPLSNISGLLFDLDGVLYIGDSVVDGAVEALNRIKSLNIPCRFTTNTTTKSLSALYRKLVNLGLPIEEEEVFGVIRATQAYLRERGKPTCFLMLSDDPLQDFAEFPVDERHPDVVVIGDVGKRWDYDLMNRVFNMVINGAEMVALHKGRYWQTEDGLQMDIGAFVAGLEYVTGKEATVIGKPSKSFFELALKDMQLTAEGVAMIGDDIVNDIGGAQNAGMNGILVKTGKYREDLVSASDISPDLIVDSITSIPGLLGV